MATSRPIFATWGLPALSLVTEYTSAMPVPLALSQNGLVDEKDMPHALMRFTSCSSEVCGTSDTKLTCLLWLGDPPPFDAAITQANVVSATSPNKHRRSGLDFISDFWLGILLITRS